MKKIIHRNIKSFDLLHFNGHAFCLCGPDVFKELVKIARGTFIVISTGSFGDTVGQTVPANSLQFRSSPHGILPAYIFAFFYTLFHSQIVFAGSAIIKIITVFKINNTCLHPKTGICYFCLFIRFYHPYLTA